MAAIGAVLLAISLTSRAGYLGFHVGSPIVWVGIGLILGGGGCLESAWEKKRSRRAETSAPSTTPRLSRKAIIGALWAPLLFVGLVPTFVVHEVRRQEPLPQDHATPTVSESSRDAATPRDETQPVQDVVERLESSSSDAESPIWLTILLLGVLLPLAATAPFGTTILGFLSIGDIRHSEGNVVGLPLALFDALFYPLLLLDGLILGLGVASFTAVVELLASNGVNVSNRLAFGLPLMIVGVILCVLIDVLVVRSAWIRATRGATPAKPG